MYGKLAIALLVIIVIVAISTYAWLKAMENQFKNGDDDE